jgi:DNA-binding Lrp family transcriptional regulator
MDPILDILTQDARKTPAEIAALTGLDEASVSQTIAKYEQDGTILKYKAVLNSERVEGDGLVRALIEVSVTPQRGVGFDAIAERIYRFREVRSCYLLSGGYDLLVVVEGQSLHEVATFVAQKLATQDNVTRTATHFMLKVFKEDGDILGPAETSSRLPVSP